MFALWPMGRYGDILGQNHKILLKNRKILKERYNNFIFTSIFDSILALTTGNSAYQISTKGTRRV
jgi:hypothetical protein